MAGVIRKGEMMGRRSAVALTAVVMAATISCARKGQDVWFDGDLEAARAAAAARDTVVMAEFYADW